MRDNILFLIALIFIPFIYLSSVYGNIWYSQFLAFMSLILLGVSVFIMRFNILYGLLTIVCLYSYLFTFPNHLMNWLPVQKYLIKGFMYTIQIYLSCLAIYFLSSMPRAKRIILFKSLLMIFLIQGVWIILQYFNKDPIFIKINNPSLDDTVGFAGSHNQIGLFFAVMLPYLFVYFPYLLPIAFFGLWCSLTTTCWVAGGIGLAICGIRFKKRLLILTILSSALLGYAGASERFKIDDFSSIALKERLDVWGQAIKAVESGKAYIHLSETIKTIVPCNPWFGYGITNFSWMGPNMQIEILHQDPRDARFPAHVYNHAHNDFVEFFFENGRLGMLVIFFIIIDLIRKFILSFRSKEVLVTFACIAVFLLSACGIFAVHVASSGALIVVFLGLFYGFVNDQRRINGETSALA